MKVNYLIKKFTRTILFKYLNVIIKKDQNYLIEILNYN